MSDSKKSSLQLMLRSKETVSPQTIDRLTYQLQSEIINMKGVSVETVQKKAAPKGTMSPDSLTIGAVVIAVVPTALASLINYLNAWMQRTESRVSIKKQSGDQQIEIDIPKSFSKEKLEEIVNFLSSS